MVGFNLDLLHKSAMTNQISLLPLFPFRYLDSSLPPFSPSLSTIEKIPTSIRFQKRFWSKLRRRKGSWYLWRKTEPTKSLKGRKRVLTLDGLKENTVCSVEIVLFRSHLLGTSSLSLMAGTIASWSDTNLLMIHLYQIICWSWNRICKLISQSPWVILKTVAKK